VAAYSGLRLKNVVELMWENVDLKADWLSVRQSKTGNPVSVSVCNKLKSIFESIKLRPINQDGPIFPGVKSKAVSTAFRRASAKAGFAWASFHSLRHFCGSFLANNGVRREVIAEVLGHRDLRSTQIYTHFRKETVRQAVDVFDREPAVVSPNCRQVEG
jgi:integrase